MAQSKTKEDMSPNVPNDNSVLVYNPDPKPQETPPPPEYTLVKDGTGKDPIKRGVQILTDTKGRSFKVPRPPNPKCKKCRGRGWIGYDVRNEGKTILCGKCFPDLEL